MRTGRRAPARGRCAITRPRLAWLNLRETLPVRQRARTIIRRALASGRPTTRGTTQRGGFFGTVMMVVVVGTVVVGAVVVVGCVVVVVDVDPVVVPVVPVLVVPEPVTVKLPCMIGECGSH